MWANAAAAHEKACGARRHDNYSPSRHGVRVSDTEQVHGKGMPWAVV